jgi:hypothetical protein
MLFNFYYLSSSVYNGNANEDVYIKITFLLSDKSDQKLYSI